MTVNRPQRDFRLVRLKSQDVVARGGAVDNSSISLSGVRGPQASDLIPGVLRVQCLAKLRFGPRRYRLGLPLIPDV